MKPDSGPAFPKIGYETPTDGWKSGQEGMSLRDYFAAAALQGFIGQAFLKSNPISHVEEAYRYADAMLAERDK